MSEKPEIKYETPIRVGDVIIGYTHGGNEILAKSMMRSSEAEIAEVELPDGVGLDVLANGDLVIKVKIKERPRCVKCGTFENITLYSLDTSGGDIVNMMFFRPLTISICKSCSKEHLETLFPCKNLG